MTQQYGSGDFRPTVGKVDGTVNIYNPVIANSSNHQASTLSWLDEIYQTSVDDNPHQRSFMAPSSLLYVFPGPQTRVEVPDSKVAVQVDSMADGVQKNTHSGSASQTDDQTLNESRVITEVVPNSSDHERYKTEGTQIPMMQFGAKLFPDDCSYLPTSFKCSTSGSRWLHTKPEEENRASQTHNEGEQLGTLLTTNPLPAEDQPLIELTDFGLSRKIDPDDPWLSTRCGSESYAAPELLIVAHSTIADAER
ncbi:hypothetical protein EDB83DRAFT_2518571 [Lactarius deliciosus]|nr:hypothetical protein EDB83DRAFT_2518571 [Lactarius deliciosus]